MGIQQALLGVGGTSFTPVTNNYYTGSGTETVPAGASFCAIAVWGGGSAGDVGGTATGGGSGAEAARTIAVTGGNTLSYSVAAAVVGRGSPGAGITGNSSTVSGTVAGGSVSMTGGGGSTVGNGGTATGGSANYAGQSTSTLNGASAPNGGLGGGAGAAGNAPGGGGGGVISGTSGGGAAGQVQFSYT